MMAFFESVLDHINYLGAVALFVIGLHTVVTHSNLIKKIMGINIMGTAVFLFFVAIGNVTGGVPPIITGGDEVYINPLPSVLILTGIVVVVSITVYSLSLVVRIYETHGTVDQKEIAKLNDKEAGL